MMYVIPFCSSSEEQVNTMENVKGRLRAFPALRQDFKIYSKEEYPYKVSFPKHVEKVILDSGAFALSTVKRKMDTAYILALEQYYFYNADERCICVAPDMFLNPIQSMYNFKKWHAQTGLKVAAVLQSDRKNSVNLKELMKQAEYYRKYTDVIFFSNPSLTGETAKGFHLQKLFKFMKKELEVKWIHNLGAGWSIDDIKSWREIGYFDSMDSISYYSTKDVAAFGSLDPIKNIKNIMKVMNSDASI